MPLTGDEVRKAGFRERWRGYDPKVVDPLLDQIATNLDAGRSITELVHQARTTDFGMKLRGYHPRDVDRFLARLREQD